MKKYLSVLLGLAVLVTPFVATAQTDVDSSGVDSCAILKVNLRYGMRDSQDNGNSVSVLQDFLYSHGYLTLQPTGFFGSLTRTAVTSFQNNNSIPATPPGFVGPITRARIQAIDCGTETAPVPMPTTPPTPCPLTVVNGVAVHVCPERPPVISKLTGPQTLDVNQIGKWTIVASDSSGGNLSYSVNWGEGSSAPVTMSSPQSSQQAATFTYNYSQAGTYTPTFTVTNTSGQSTQGSLSVSVAGKVTNSPLVKVLSPNGGETWKKGTTNRISWQDNGGSITSCPLGTTCVPPPRVAPTYDIFLDSAAYSCPGDVCTSNSPRVIAKNVTGSSYDWTIPNCTAANTCSSNFEIAEGSYRIRICKLDSTTCDSSDSPFKVVGGTTVAPTSTLKATPTSIVSDGKPGTATLTWYSTNTIFCTLSSSPYNAGWAKEKTFSTGQQSVSITETTNFSMACEDNSGQSTKSTATVNMTYNSSAPSISYLTPTSATAGNKDLISVFGSGFTLSHFVTLTGYTDDQSGYDTPINPATVSTDGKKLTFNVPTFVKAGTYSIGVAEYGKTASNYVSFRVNTAPVVPSTPHAATGVLDRVECDTIGGWSYDEDTPTDATAVHIYYDGPAGSGTFLTDVYPNTQRDDLNAHAGITGMHGFTLLTPNVLKNGNSHTVYAYAIDSAPSHSLNSLLVGSPKTINCSSGTKTSDVSVSAQNATQIAEVLASLKSLLQQLFQSFQ